MEGSCLNYLRKDKGEGKKKKKNLNEHYSSTEDIRRKNWKIAKGPLRKRRSLGKRKTKEKNWEELVRPSRGQRRKQGRLDIVAKVREGNGSSSVKGDWEDQ